MSYICAPLFGVAEPHHFNAAPAPKIFLMGTRFLRLQLQSNLLYSKPSFWKRKKVYIRVEATIFLWLKWLWMGKVRSCLVCVIFNFSEPEPHCVTAPALPHCLFLYWERGPVFKYVRPLNRHIKYVRSLWVQKKMPGMQICLLYT
jgi:hypothetical protein